MKVTNLITDKILRDIADINDKCHAMHLPSPPVQFFQMEVRDADGTVVEVLKSKSNSWVRNAYNMLAQLFLPCNSYEGSSTFGEGSQSIKLLAGTTQRNATYITILQGGTYSNAYNASASAAYGIIIGTGETAESFDSYALAALIAHGTGTGQMSYGAGTAPSVSYSSELKEWTSVMTRTFTNSSGAAITVKEIGLAYSLTVSGGSVHNALISRDVLASPITINNGQTLTITYTSEITYPA